MKFPSNQFEDLHTILVKALASAKERAETMTQRAHEKINEAGKAVETAMVAMEDLEKIAETFEPLKVNITESMRMHPEMLRPPLRATGSRIDLTQLERDVQLK